MFVYLQWKKYYNIFMKKFFAMCALLITSTAVARGDSGWLMVTDAGMRIPMEHVGMLVVADNARTFSVIRTVGEAVSGVTSVTFSYDPSSSGITEVSATEVGILPDAVSSTVTLMGCRGRQFTVCDMSGRIYISAVIANDSETVDVSALSGGIYVLSVCESSVKFIKR